MKDGNDQTMVPCQCIVQSLGQRFFGLAARVPFQDMLCQLHFPVQHLHILFLEVALDRIANEQAEQKQYEGRGQRE
ncbi:hypothetical protein SDC9_158278 [bioreactor metagenome]|jgi:hypothetical protein|uniref:Uncharacterized protein n=1 Tax=bioreactor metagenome TaxID=1076179 RepID=A0A645FAP6_9ZZZZ